MSGSKSGEITIAPVAIRGAVAAGIGAAVSAYRAERERIRRMREQATNEQRGELAKAMAEWRSRMAASAGSADPPRHVRSGEEIMAAMVTPLPGSSGLRAEDYLKGVLASAGEAASPPPPPQGTASVEFQQITENIQELLDNLTIPLPANVAAKLSALQNEMGIERAAAMARDIRVAVSREMEWMKQEQQDARRVLDDLPPDFPDPVRKLLCEAAEGCGRFDDYLRNMVRKTMEQVQVCRQREAANILLKTLSEMGYDVEPVEASLFAEGGKVHFRNSQWEDGYCVRLGIKGAKVNFNMMKNCPGDSDTDHAAELGWEEELKTVREKLAESGVVITNFNVKSVPGKTAVPLNYGIPMDTRKRAGKKSAAKASQARMGGQG